MYDFKEFKQKMDEIKQWLRDEYAKISTGRAKVEMLDSILVEMYNDKQPIKSLASINLEDARTLRIAPWQPDAIRPIENALRDSGLPLSISVDDNGLRATVPEMTEDKREDLLKVLKKKLEEARISVRNERHEVDKEIDKGDDFTEDEQFHSKEKLQDIVEETNDDLQAIYDEKEKQVMTV